MNAGKAHYMVLDKLGPKHKFYGNQLTLTLESMLKHTANIWNSLVMCQIQARSVVFYKTILMPLALIK